MLRQLSISTMRRSLPAAAAVVGLAASLHAQVRLDLRIVPQDGVLPAAITNRADSQHQDLALPGEVRRFEVQYRIVDTNTGDAINPAGLAAMQFNICLSGGTPGASFLQRGRLSAFEAQQAGAVPPTATDSSGFPTGPLNTATGLHRPFRAGLPAPAPNNGNPSNGVLSGAVPQCINVISPVAVSQSNQGCIPCGQSDLSWYGLYTFELVVGAGACGRIDLTATPIASGADYFGYYDNNQPVPLTGSAYTSQPAFVNTTASFPGCIYPLCPEDGTSQTALVTTFSLSGAVTGAGWYWRIDNDPTGTPFQSMPGDVFVPGVCSTCTLFDIALATANSINSYFHNPLPSCTSTQIIATPIATGGGNADLTIRTFGRSKARLLVGSTAATCDVSPGPCPFQPSITRLTLPGSDCNGNAVDDQRDIALGISRDLNGNGVPDECEAACPLRIKGLPAFQLRSPGSTATFTVSAQGAGVTYQWRRNGMNLGNGPTASGSVISGATGSGGLSTLTITDVRLPDDGSYDCIVSNACATLTAGPIGLRVICPADYNRSLTISNQDIFDFLADMFSNNPRADVNHSGAVSVEDLYTFLAQFFLGCP